ncbi:AAA family ATPase [Gorillibacterium sp. sgz5001074]|uniref:AAA family ATPase n=1 Tax=Gorillibacterium sp. sgz5001074 TaxID=3446695 RepID=UPI003F681E48
MIIRQIRAEGFGALRDRTVELEGPVTVLYGPNEAGKSTLLQLIRAVLFGFPSRSQSSERYEPVGGRAHGGLLELETQAGERVRVVRYAGGDTAGGRGRNPSAGTLRVIFRDGTEGSEELLRQLLGGVTAEQFRNLFAFTLTELQELRTLTSGELGGFLHSAGLGVRASAVAETERRLAQELEARFRPRGKNQGIGRLLAEADRLEAEWRRSLAAAGRYNAMADELERLAEEIASEEEELAALREELAFLRAAGPLRDKWVRSETLRKLRSELAPLTASRPPYPEDGLERHEALIAELERRDEEVRRLQAAEQRWLQRLEAWTEEDEAVAAGRWRLEELLGRLPLYRNGFVLESELAAELDQTREQHRLKRGELGLAPDSGGGSEVEPIPLSAQAEAREWLTRSMELAERKRRMLAEREGLLRSLAEAELRTAERAGELAALKERLRRQYPGCTDAQASDLQELVRELQREWRQAERLEQELRHLEERELERLLQLEQLQAASRKAGGSDSRWLRMPGGFALAVAAGWAGWFALRQEWLPAMIGGVLWAAAGIWILLASTRGIGLSEAAGPNQAGGPRTRSGRRYTGSDPSPLEMKRRELQAARETGEGRIRSRLEAVGIGRETAAAAAGTRAGTSGLPDWEDPEFPDRLERWMAGLTEAFRELARLEERLTDAETAHAALREQEGRMRKALTRLEADGAILQEEWSAWLLQWGIGMELPPEYAPDVLERLEQIRGLRSRLSKLEAQLAGALSERADFERACRSLTAWSDRDEADLPAALERRKEELSRVLEGLAGVKEAEAALAPLRVELEEAQNSRLITARKLEFLWAEAGAAGPEEFRRFGAESARLCACEEELRGIQELLAAGVGPERVAQLEKHLSSRGEEDLAEEVVQLENRLLALTARLDQAKERKGHLAGECGRLLEGSSHGDKREQQEELVARFREEASQWAVYAMAAGLLRRARETYERERQPAVLRLASGHFSRMTEGRYAGIMAPLGEQRLIAVRPDGEPVDSARLSRGTAEQLYLAIRFALTEEFARNEPMPLVMDDIFVNFDRARLAACVRELGVLAEKHQILVFTCHRHVVEAMTSGLPQVQVIEV